MYIIKSTGEKQEFDPEKIRRTCLRAKAPAEITEKIVREISKEIKEGTKTADIYRRVMALLERESPALAGRYDLRNAIIRLGPAGFEFEKYIAMVLAEYGFKTELPPILQGSCTTHEVDISAEKDGRRAMMECKLRVSQEIYISIKDTMSTWARFLDLVEGAGLGLCPHFDEVWLVTNSRFSRDSIQYGHCKNMVMLSWDHPRERPLPAWIEQKGLYPITILRSLQQEMLTKFSGGGIMLLRDIDALSIGEIINRTGISEEILRKLIAEAKDILGASSRDA